MYARPLTAFIDAEPTLKPLFKRLSELSYVQRIYVEAVPSALAQLGLVASIREGTLVIAAKNGAAAAKLKQLAPQIAEKVSQRLQQPVDIQVIVQVEEPADTNTARKKQAMSSVAIESLQKLAAELPPSALKNEVSLVLKRQLRAKK